MEFISKALLRIYKRWNIEPITTGGHSPWSNPVERYHRYFNSAMTTLAQKFGEDWTSYLQAATFSYNASHCRSTGHSPFKLTYGRDPTLPEDLMTHIHTNDDDEDFIDATNRMKTAFADVIKQQQKVAQYNREMKANKRNAIEYTIGDMILYWEPVQERTLHADKEEEHAFATKAPSKWKPKWTGPHKITKVTPGKYSPRYEFLHCNTRKQIINVKSSRMHIYQPWSPGIQSTSPLIDDKCKARYKIGTRCKPGDMIIIPTEQPWPFGIGKVIKTNNDDTLEVHWHNGTGYSATSKYKPMWHDGAKNKEYTATKPTHASHQPFTNTHEELIVKQTDISMHSFKLTEAGYIPKEVLDECSDNQDIWWKRITKKRKRKQQPHDLQGE